MTSNSACVDCVLERLKCLIPFDWLRTIARLFGNLVAYDLSTFPASIYWTSLVIFFALSLTFFGALLST